MKASVAIVVILLFVRFTGAAQKNAPAPCGPLPNENQLRWQEMEYYAFIHFSVNTYTNQEWGNGDEAASIFNPDSLDCRQWARICKEAGMKGVILVAKHHSGFCFWPSKYTEYSVKNCPWKNGKGDIVRDMANACKEYGLKLGLYLSPWDRNAADYGKPEYIKYFRNQLKELLTNYGDIFEIWFDGANGGSGYYGGARETRTIDRTTYYDWKNTYKMIRALQPNIVIWNDNGDRADLRWVGTESGYVGETNWSLLNATGDVPEKMLRYGVENGDSWVPGEVNTSIRPGWFYHKYEDARVKTLPQLLDVFYNSIGRNGTMLLNFPIMPDGLIHKNDESAVVQLAKAVKETFAVNLVSGAKIVASNVRKNSNNTFAAGKAIDKDKNTYWATDDGVSNPSLTINFGRATTFNRFLVQEYIRLGQRVKSFNLEALVNGQWIKLASETTIGYKRILRFPTVQATQLRLQITGSKCAPLISNMGVYNAPVVLTAPEITRNQSGEIIFTPADKEAVVYYTLDGKMPTTSSTKYTAPFLTDGKVIVQAMAYAPATGKSSPVSKEKFDVSKKEWKIEGIGDKKAYDAIDGNPHTAWYQTQDKRMPIDLVIDMGKEENLSGFKYLPGQGRTTGIIAVYRFFVSQNNVDWTLVSEGEFSNIQNNPLWQVKNFELVKARYIKLQALKNTQSDQAAGYAELDIVTY
ncbi:MAG: alpha-L-fucosidase [Chitinophagaceae bacterium]